MKRTEPDESTGEKRGARLEMKIPGKSEVLTTEENHVCLTPNTTVLPRNVLDIIKLTTNFA